MTTSGWIVMILSAGGVTVFFLTSLYLVMKMEKNKKHLHSTLDETPDIKE